MELEQILGTIREHYLAGYRAAITRYKNQFKPGGPEVLFELPHRQSALVYRYYRADLASGAVDPPNFTDVNLETHLDFEPMRFERGGLPIQLSPLVWNGVQFRIQPSLKDDMRLQSWGLRWLDPGEGTTPDQDGLGAYIHSITAPDHNSEATEFSVDFGSAPVDCILELLDVVMEAGAETVEMHSRSMLE